MAATSLALSGCEASAAGTFWSKYDFTEKAIDVLLGSRSMMRSAWGLSTGNARAGPGRTRRARRARGGRRDAVATGDLLGVAGDGGLGRARDGQRAGRN